jgi:ribonuclease P protein component
MRRHPGPPASGTPDEVMAATPAGAPGAAGADGPPSRRQPQPTGERLLPRERMVKRADYLRCYRTGRRRLGALAILYFAPNPLGYPRIGITTSRKVGNAVVRHRLKRRVKEIYRRWTGRGRLTPIDLVVHLKPEAKSAGFGEVSRDLLRLLDGLAYRRERGAGSETRG